MQEQGAGTASRWRARLESLTPDRPGAYFDLAEEIADAARSDQERSVARQLFGLAGVLEPNRYARSACLALADMETGESAKRRLLALAAILHPTPGLQTATMPERTRPAFGGEAALSLSEAIGLLRIGEGNRALSRLDRPGTRAMLESVSGAIRGGARRFEEDCRHYRQGRLPPLTPADINDLLRLEQALLAGERRTWSSELLLTAGRPLLEVDPDDLPGMLGADPSRPFYRDGRWSVRP